jgi:hypothetical protein
LDAEGTQLRIHIFEASGSGTSTLEIHFCEKLHSISKIHQNFIEIPAHGCGNIPATIFLGVFDTFEITRKRLLYFISLLQVSPVLKQNSLSSLMVWVPMNTGCRR